MNGYSDSVLASWSAVSLPTIPSCCTNCSCTRDWPSQTSFEVIWYLGSALIAARKT
jgi:hypothetical protein